MLKPNETAERLRLAAKLIDPAVGNIPPRLFNEGAAEIDALAARLAEVERDAARYRWLRGDGGSQSRRWPRWIIQHWAGGLWNPVQQESMDDAIDAAMFAEQQITPSTSAAPRFAETFCSQCGHAFGPGNSGYSHCWDHSGSARLEVEP